MQARGARPRRYAVNSPPANSPCRYSGVTPSENGPCRLIAPSQTLPDVQRWMAHAKQSYQELWPVWAIPVIARGPDNLMGCTSSWLGCLQQTTTTITEEQCQRACADSRAADGQGMRMMQPVPTVDKLHRTSRSPSKDRKQTRCSIIDCERTAIVRTLHRN